MTCSLSLPPSLSYKIQYDRHKKITHSHSSTHSPVLCAHVGALPVLGGRVVHLEENLKQVGRRNLERVELHLDDLGVTRVARGDLGGGGVTVIGEGISHKENHERETQG